MNPLSRVFIFKIAATVVFWCLPLLLLPGQVLAGLGFPPDRSGRTTDHAHRVHAMHASIGNHEIAQLRSVSDESWIVIVGRGASTHAIVATRTTIGIDQHGLRSVHEALVQQELHHG